MYAGIKGSGKTVRVCRLSEPRLLADVLTTKISWIGSYMGLNAESLYSAFPTRSYPNQPAGLQRQARKLKFCTYIVSLNMMLSNNRITNVRICSGWFAPFMFANPEDRFPHVEAHILKIFQITSYCLFLLLYVPSQHAMVMAGRSVHLTTLFLGQA